MEILEEKVDVLSAEVGTTYSGGIVNFSRFRNSDIEHHIGRGWAASGNFKEELCCKTYQLKQRIKLFTATGTATVLYGSGAWTMTIHRENLLQHEESAQKSSWMSETTPRK